MTSATSILFVSGDESTFTSLRGAFRAEASVVHSYASVARALQFLRLHSVDIVVSEMRMQEMSGIEFLNRVAALCPESIRILTGDQSDRGVVMNAISRGLAHYYLIKPCDEAAFKDLIRRGMRARKELQDKNLEAFLRSSNTLPSAPSLYVRLRPTLFTQDDSVRHIVAEVEKSPALVAKILRVANSVYYGARTEITAVREAVIFIGTEYIANLVLAIEAFQNLSQLSGGETLVQIEALWLKSVHRAALAKAISKEWPVSVDSSTAYVASLLLEIGYVVRLVQEPELYQRFLALQQEEQTTPFEADVKVFGLTHDQVGAALLKFWNLPERLVDIVGSHHGPTGPDPLRQVVQLAHAVEDPVSSRPHDPQIEDLLGTWKSKLSSLISQ